MNINSIKLFLFSLYWVFKYYLGLKNLLRVKYKIEKLSILKFMQWHSGAAYFIGVFKGEKVFIKTDSNTTGIIDNEYLACKVLNSKNSMNFPKPILKERYKNVDFIVISFLEGVSLDVYLKKSEKNSVILNKPIIANYLFDILLTLHELQIIHRDIRPENIQIIEDDKGVNVVLFDFAYCIDSISWESANRYNEVDSLPYYLEIMKSLGEDYKKGLYQWDDAYSIYEILKRNNLKIEDNTDVLLKGLVSKETYSIKVD
jgi:serine/threonine protein kinase